MMTKLRGRVAVRRAAFFIGRGTVVAARLPPPARPAILGGLREGDAVEIRSDPDGFERLFVTVPEWAAEFSVSGACPVQAFGTVRGRELYFRARHGVWSFDVADSAGHLPSDGYRDSDGFYREGDDPHAGHMPLREAVAVIEGCLREYAALH